VNSDIIHRQQQLYWSQMVELKVAVAYIRRYRDRLDQLVAGLGTLRAVASSGSIAGWALWKQFAFFWAVVIASSQVVDALKDVFPFTKKHKAASAHAVSLSSMFIDAQLEWENIFAGNSDEQIMNRRHKLMKLQHDTERNNFPDGLAVKESLFAEAQQEAKDYFRSVYGV